MSNMDGNPHFHGAMQFSGWARNNREAVASDLTPEAAAYRDYAQIQATLALAYEQRTANLIAHISMLAQVADMDVQDDLQDANREIMTRMGINEGATK